MRKTTDEEKRIKRAAYRAANRDKILARQKIWRDANKERHCQKASDWYYANRDRTADNNMRRKFGISLDDYNAILESQDGKCAICKTETPGKGDRFSIDHDHKTGKVRGLLCVHCNVGIGHFRDDPLLLQAAIGYLAIHSPE